MHGYFIIPDINCFFCLFFASQGQRLGSSNNENAYGGGVPRQMKSNPPAPVITNTNLNDGDRAELRAQRAAAAEARMKKQGIKPGKKPKKQTGEPLRGPNSQPLMRWTTNG